MTGSSDQASAEGLHADGVSRRRGRPRDANVDNAVLRSGYEVLAEQGYAGLTFEAVAERAGCSRPSLYRRFSDKRELVMAIINTTVGELIRTSSQALTEAEASDPQRLLVQYLTGYVSYLKTPGGGGTLAVSQARRSDAALAEALEQLFLRERERYVAVLNRAAATTLLPVFCHLVIDGMLGAVAFRVALRNAEIAPEEIESIVELALRAVRAGPTAALSGALDP